jgi:hypothetical protein
VSCVGRFLIRFSIEKAYLTGKQKFWCYSEDDPFDSKANGMYALFGFKVVRVEPLLGVGRFINKDLV